MYAASTCESCSIGQHQDQPGSTACDACVLGEHSALQGQSECAICPAGTYSVTHASAMCASCSSDPGLTCESNGLVVVEEDYWAWSSPYQSPSMPHVTNGIQLKTVPCIKGRCEGGNGYGTERYQPCGLNRNQQLNNTLCGLCDEARGFSELGTACISMSLKIHTSMRSCHNHPHTCMIIECDKPQAGMIFAALLCTIGVVFILHLTAQTGSGLPPIFFYFGMI